MCCVADSFAVSVLQFLELPIAPPEQAEAGDDAGEGDEGGDDQHAAAAVVEPEERRRGRQQQPGDADFPQRRAMVGQSPGQMPSRFGMRHHAQRRDGLPSGIVNLAHHPLVPPDELATKRLGLGE